VSRRLLGSVLAGAAVSVAVGAIVDARRARRPAVPPPPRPVRGPRPEPAEAEPEAPVDGPLPRRRVRKLVVLETVVIALGIAALVLGRAGFIGSPISYVVVAGHSMQPTLHLGDVVVLGRASAYRKGEVIAYKVPAGGPGAGLMVIHRIVGGNARDGYVMRGDNKQFNDPWRPRPRDVVGRELFMVPKLGLAIRYVRSPLGFAALAGLLTMTLMLAGGGGAGDGRSRPRVRPLEPTAS